METKSAQQSSALAGALIEAAGSVEELMRSVEGNTPKTVPTKKDTVMTKPAPSAKIAKATKSPIARLYTDPVGKKVAVGNITFLIEERKSSKTQEPTRVLRVAKSKDDKFLGRFLFVHELDYETLAYKPGSPVEIYDDKVALHALLRPLAVEVGLAKVAVQKAKPAHKIQKGKDVVAKPTSTPLMRMDTVVAPGSQPVVDFGVARLLTAPADKKISVGAHSFIVEEAELDNGNIGRRYVCVRAPEDFGLGIWVTDDDVRHCVTPRLSDKMKGRPREAKLTLHQLLRDAAIEAKLVKGKYAMRPVEVVTDQVVVIASIKDAIDGRYVVQHPDFDEDAIIAIELEDGRHGQEMQIILVKGNNEGLDGIKPGTRLAHKAFMKRLRPANMPEFLERFADWLDEAVF